MIVKSDPDTVKGFLEDNSGLKGGHVEKVFFPETTEDISEILTKANQQSTLVTIAGNGTGVTGGRIPFGGIVIATERLNRILDIKRIDDKSGIIGVQAGVTLKDIKDATDKQMLLYPPDPTEESAYIGGNIATNASGARGYRYGSTRRYVKGLKVVLANGHILDLKRGYLFAKERAIDISSLDKKMARLNLPKYKMPSIKNAAGYYVYDNMDLIDIFIGQEGTLGVVSEAELGLVQKEEGILGFFTFFDSDDDAQAFVSCLKDEEVLSIEYFDANSLKLLKDKFPNIPEARASIFFEKEASKKDEDIILNRVSNLLKENRASYDKTLFAQSAKEHKNLHEIRHSLPEVINEIIKRNGFPKVGTDIAVPKDRFSDMLSLYKSSLGQRVIPYVIFGHIGECHLHVNMLPSTKKEYELAKTRYLKFVEMALEFGGTVSAEHGIGKLKHIYLEKMYGHRGISEMIALKKNLDPNCILGRDNIFPKELLS